RHHRGPAATGPTYPVDPEPGGGAEDLPHTGPRRLRAALRGRLPRDLYRRGHVCRSRYRGRAAEEKAGFRQLARPGFRAWARDLRARQVDPVTAAPLVEKPRGLPGRPAGSRSSVARRVVEADPPAFAPAPQRSPGVRRSDGLPPFPGGGRRIP